MNEFDGGEQDTRQGYPYMPQGRINIDRVIKGMRAGLEL